MRTEPCVCGGRIYAEPGREGVAVLVHARSLLHLIWRLRVGILTPAVAGPNDPQRWWPTVDSAPPSRPTVGTDDPGSGALDASATSVEGAA